MHDPYYIRPLFTCCITQLCTNIWQSSHILLHIHTYLRYSGVSGHPWLSAFSAHVLDFPLEQEAAAEFFTQKFPAPRTRRQRLFDCVNYVWLWEHNIQHSRSCTTHFRCERTFKPQKKLLNSKVQTESRSSCLGHVTIPGQFGFMALAKHERRKRSAAFLK